MLLKSENDRLQITWLRLLTDSQILKSICTLSIMFGALTEEMRRLEDPQLSLTQNKKHSIKLWCMSGGMVSTIYIVITMLSQTYVNTRCQAGPKAVM